MKLKRARRPQSMFLFDPDFRYRHVDEPASKNAIAGNKKRVHMVLDPQRFCKMPEMIHQT